MLAILGRQPSPLALAAFSCPANVYPETPDTKWTVVDNSNPITVSCDDGVTSYCGQGTNTDDAFERSLRPRAVDIQERKGLR